MGAVAALRPSLEAKERKRQFVPNLLWNSEVFYRRRAKRSPEKRESPSQEIISLGLAMKTILRTTWRLHLISMSRTPELSEVQKQVGIAIDLLTKEALPSGAKPLRKATDFCSIDAGEYRIVYSRPRGQEIYIMRIQHRDTVYKNLKRLQPPA